MKHKGNIMERRIRLKSVNPNITCSICKGYLVDATTITECLHTFCKTCIVKYLEENTRCPTCNEVIHQSHPLNYISHDRTMQDVVYKLVPGLQENELRREQTFYRKRGLPFPRSLSVDEVSNKSGDNGSVTSSTPSTPQPPEDKDQVYHRLDEQVNLCLECCANQLKVMKRKYVRCSMQATITQLKKFVALKVYNDMDRFRDVDIMCNDEILGKDHTLKFICVTRWRVKDIPLTLQYRPKVEL